MSLLHSPIMIFALVMAVFGIAAWLLLGNKGNPALRKRARTMRDRITKAATATLPADKKTAEEAAAGSLRRSEGDKSLPLLSRIVHLIPNYRLLKDRLARSGSEMTIERYVLYVMMLFAFTTLTLMLMGKGPLIGLLLGVVVGLGLPHMVIGFKIGRRTKKFLILFPEAIDLIVRGLRAGLPVTESIKMVAKEISEPVRSVFQVMVDKMALGIPLEKTLYETAQKFRITEFDFFVTSIVLQRETGGNLSEILGNLSETLRQRSMMQLKIKAMSSEARASMYIIGALPFVVMLALRVTSPEYLAPLFDDYRGNIALGIAGGMLFTGIFIMMRMAKFEI